MCGTKQENTTERKQGDEEPKGRMQPPAISHQSRCISRETLPKPPAVPISQQLHFVACGLDWKPVSSHSRASSAVGRGNKQQQIPHSLLWKCRQLFRGQGRHLRAQPVQPVCTSGLISWFLQNLVNYFLFTFKTNSFVLSLHPKLEYS